LNFYIEQYTVLIGSDIIKNAEIRVPERKLAAGWGKSQSDD